MHQVFYNITRNALESMEKGGKLKIKTGLKDNFIEVSFSDTGGGIPEENLQKIFEPLFSTKTKGTGLGFSICESLVKGHDGTIEVESEVGKGTTFTVKMPVKKSILDRSGYQAFIARDSKEAIRLVKEKEFDLIFMDLVFKGDKNGVEIYKEMKKIRPDIKAVLFTGYGPEEEMRLLRDAVLEGMIDDILRKPIHPDELMKTIEKYTGGMKDA